MTLFEDSNEANLGSVTPIVYVTRQNNISLETTRGVYELKESGDGSLEMVYSRKRELEANGTRLEREHENTKLPDILYHK